MEILRRIVQENPEKPNFYIRNLLKQYLQVLILDFIYSSKEYSHLFFYGGTSLSLCYNLPRLSEDLDFVNVEKNVKLEEFANDIHAFFEKEVGLIPKVKVQKFRIYLKFPILKELGLSKGRDESDLLFVKVEVFSNFDFCSKFKKEFKPIFKFNRSVLVKTFDMPTLMSTKILAVLHREWTKKDKQGKVLTQVKGRDFFDLMWFLQNGIEPNFVCLEGIKNKEELKEKLLEKIRGLDQKSVCLDLENFVSNENFVKNLSKNMKEILESELKRF